jgi:hypothetical protein
VTQEKKKKKKYVVDEAKPQQSGVNITALGVPPAEPRDDGGDDKGHEEEEGEIPAMLKPDDVVPVQIGHVGGAELPAGQDDHPTDVGPEKTLVGVVRVELGIGVPMVSAVASGPPLDAALDGAGTCESEDILEGFRGVVGSMGPETVIACGDAEAGEVIVCDREKDGFPSKLGEVGADDAEDGGEGEDGDVEPVELVAPIAPREGRKGLLSLDGVVDVVVGDVEDVVVVVVDALRHGEGKRERERERG